MASTNLFKSLYSRDNSKISSGFICNSARNEDDTSFDISGNNGVITDSNGNTLASIPLTSIHAADISQYNVETRILQPNSCYVLQGQEFGLAMTSYYFHIPEIITEVDGYEYYTMLDCDLIYNQYHHTHMHLHIPVSGESELITETNKFLDGHDIEINVTVQVLKDFITQEEHEYLVFQAVNEGYFFFIKNVKLTPVLQSDEYPESPFSTEIEDKKYLIYTYIKEFHPCLPNVEYDESSYEIPCTLYNWILTNFDESISQLNKLKSALEYINSASYLANDIKTKLSSGDYNIEDTVIQNMYNDINDFTSLANESIENSIFNNDVISTYDNDNIQAIANIIEALKVDYDNAQFKYTQKFWLYENDIMRIPMMKYPNGAFRGIVIIPDYPENDNYEFSTLYINHVQSIVNIDIPDKEYPDLFRKDKFGVMSNVMFKQEAHECSANPHNGSCVKFQSNTQLKTDILDGWDNADLIETNTSNDLLDWHIYNKDLCNNDTHTGEFDQEHFNCNNHDIVYLGESCYSDKTKIIGLYRYMQYVNENHLWLNIGDAYMAIGKADNHQNNYIHNLLPSVMIYNPNDIPIRIQYLIFS